MSERFDGRVTRQIGGWLVRRYPHPWRRRYQDEVLSLLDESSVRWRDVADLALGLITERARSVFEPGDRPIQTVLVMQSAAMSCGVALSITAVLVGWAARLQFGHIPVGLGDFAIQVTVTVLMAKIWFPLSWEDLTRPAPRPLRRPGMWLVLVLVAFALESWARGVPESVEWSAWFAIGATSLVPSLILTPVLWSHEPWSRIPAAVRQLAASRHELKWGRLELERCERLATEGTASPLEEARATIVRITTSRDEALATLHAMGYRARFVGPPD